MASIWDNIQHQFKAGGMYLKLVYINVALFLIVKIAVVVGDLMNFNGQLTAFVYNYLCVSTDLKLLLFRPWTLLSSMFLQIGFMHLFSNMLMLFFLGQMLETYVGGKKILSLYLLGGIIGSLFQIAAKNIFPLMSEMPDYPILGASGAVFAIAVGLVTYSPNLEVRLFGVIPAKLIYIVGLLFLLEFFNLSNVEDRVAHFAHVGGGLFGFWVMLNYRKGKDYLKWLDQLQGRLSGGRQPRMKVKYSKFREQKNDQQPPRDDYDYNANKQAQQERLDRILDKIKHKGYDGLTKEEKDFLNKF